MAANPISKSSTEWLGSASDCVAITPHATNPLARPTRGFQVNVAGDVAVRFTDSTADVTLTLLAGVTYAYSISHVRVTGTTATGIFGLY